MAMAEFGRHLAEVDYYCHSCSQSIGTLRSELTCPLCGGGFVEELQGSLQAPAELSTFIQEPFSNLRRFLSRWRSYDESSDSRQLSSMYSDGSSRRHANQTILEAGEISDHFIRLIMSMLSDDEDESKPASQSQLDKLSVLKVGPIHLRSCTQCCICMDNYTLGESIISLPCEHFYHQACITTWLRQHSSCPVCRNFLPAAPSTTSPSSTSNENLSFNIGENRLFRASRMSPSETQARRETSHVHLARDPDNDEIFETYF